MAVAFKVGEREQGAVKKTDEALQAVPLPRQSAKKTPPLQIPQPVEPPTPDPVGADYKRDTLDTDPMSALPVNMQNALATAQMWYQVAAHPGATDFERQLAEIHIDELIAALPPEVAEQVKEIKE